MNLEMKTYIVDYASDELSGIKYVRAFSAKDVLALFMKLGPEYTTDDMMLQILLIPDEVETSLQDAINVCPVHE